ncbi:MAG: hypothetical protein QFC55_04425, partial [Chloroflexota bacterium]|nr:hypothetical protein [Chloroflexota bacterium]
GRTAVLVGSLVAQQEVQIVLRLNFPLGEIGRMTGAVLSVAANGADADDASASLTWDYADDFANDKQERDTEVDRAVGLVFASRARLEASQLNRLGNFPAAQAALAAVAKRIRSYAGRDAALRELVVLLEEESHRVAAPMAPADRKQMYFASHASLRSRDMLGKATKARDQ